MKKPTRRRPRDRRRKAEAEAAAIRSMMSTSPRSAGRAHPPEKAWPRPTRPSRAPRAAAQARRRHGYRRPAPALTAPSGPGAGKKSNRPSCVQLGGAIQPEEGHPTRAMLRWCRPQQLRGGPRGPPWQRLATSATTTVASRTGRAARHRSARSETITVSELAHRWPSGFPTVINTL